MVETECSLSAHTESSITEHTGATVLCNNTTENGSDLEPPVAGQAEQVLTMTVLPPLHSPSVPSLPTSSESNKQVSITIL